MVINIIIIEKIKLQRLRGNVMTLYEQNENGSNYYIP